VVPLSIVRNSSCLAIIPARGGSKGVPRKNVLPLCGKPLIAWNIEAARQARHIERVAVSTDDAEIAEVSRRWGAEIIWRPAKISGDMASSEAALLHALEHLAETEDYRPELLVFLQCTSPLTAPEDIDGTIEALNSEAADSAVAVVDFHYFLWRTGPDGEAEGINHDKSVRLLRQQRERQFLETGAIYVMRTAGFIEHRHRFFGRTAMHVTPVERRLEIDEPVDFKVAEMLLRERLQRQRLAALPERIGGVAFDFDGVFTNNRVLVAEDGQEAVLCNRSDGWGLARLRETGIPTVVISTEKNPVVAARCRKLGLDCRQGIDDKVAAIHRWAEEIGASLEQLVFLGNDVNDLAALQAVGCPAVVADAHPEAVRNAQLVLERAGGDAAVRELCDLIQLKLLEQ